MPPLRCGWPASSRRTRVRSSRTVSAAPRRCITCLLRSGLAGRQLDGAAIGPQTKHSLERVAAESLWRPRQKGSPQQAERPRDTGHPHPMTRPARSQSPLTDMKSGQNGPGRGDPGAAGGRSGDSHARGTTGPVIADQQIIRLYAGDRLTLRQIRERFAVSHSRVVRVLDRHHIARRPPGPRSRLAASDEPADRQIVDRYPGGLSLRQAGKPFGAGPGLVTAVLDRHHCQCSTPS